MFYSTALVLVGPLSQFEIMGLQGKNLGLWDYTLFEIGITEISFEIGIIELKSNQIGIFNPFKLGLRNFTLIEIGTMGLRIHQF